MTEYDDFQTEQVTVELRYPAAVLLWDETGKIWSQVLGHFPELKPVTLVPNQQIFESVHLRVSTELEALRVLARGPKPEIRGAEVAQALFEICSKRLNLWTFNRIGLRVIRSRKFATIREATADALLLLPDRITRSLRESAQITALNVGLRQETDVAGLIAGVRAEEREIKVNFPWEVANRVPEELAKQFTKENVVIIDSDYYTIGATQAESLNLVEWSKQGERFIKKFWKEVLQ
jgi:hypothetical protein